MKHCRNIPVIVNLSSANASNLDQSEILSSGNVLNNLEEEAL